MNNIFYQTIMELIRAGVEVPPLINLIKEKNVLVVLDFGHGGLDKSGKYVTPGKRSPNWTGVSNPVHNEDIYYEGVGNREIGFYVTEKLKGLGVNYVKLVHGYKDISLRERVKAVNAISHPKVFGVSIHSNAGGGTGSEVFTSPGDTLADPMATIAYEELKKEFPKYAARTNYTDGDPDKEAMFTILALTKIPFFLIEAFFMDRKKECKEILMTVEGKKRIASWIVSTIIRIILEKY